MAKMKTRKSIAKRFKKTGSGKLKRNQQGMRHKLGQKSSKRKRQLRKTAITSEHDQKRIIEAIPY
ncbi:MAG TPA: 50S ribosomal protein L35 [Tissierellia bacterium]|nr:50S ribosomal protein L35 [Tissierellia bacterium]